MSGDHPNGRGLAYPTARETVRLPAFQRPILLVVIDTEEEFDWSSAFDRSQTSVRSMQNIGLLQEVFEEFGIRPTYVADYPVVTQEDGRAPLREFQAAGRAEVGAHLHPWVSPPHEEEVCSRNSYPGNLERELELRKLQTLTAAIEENIGHRPSIYKSGRYGFGPNTADILEELDYEVDLSACPAFDLRADGGPDYSAFPSDSYWFGKERRLLGVPTTGAFVGFWQSRPERLYRLATGPGVRWARLPAVLSRLGALDRLHLSPEGYGTRDHRRLCQHLFARGLRVFTFSLHSPSTTPGCTPYVQSQADLQRLLDACRYFFEFFLGELNGLGMTPLELKDHLLRPRLAQPPKATSIP